MRTLRELAHALVASTVVAMMTTAAAADTPASAQSIRAQHAALAEKLENGPFGQPVYLHSSESAGRLAGDVHAVIEHPFAAVRKALGDAASWCDILILHPNIKHCEVDAGAPRERWITVHLGNAELPVRFSYKVAASEADYFDVRLHAAEGPFGTTDYRVALAATPLDARRTILQLSYAHGYGTRARLAMQAYFQTLGRNKVGFTVVGQGADGQPIYVGDFRGGLERNAMRYFFAIEAYLDTLALPQQQQPERRLAAWLAQIQRHPRQLREEAGYVERKRGEMQRQQPAGSARG